MCGLGVAALAPWALLAESPVVTTSDWHWAVRAWSELTALERLWVEMDYQYIPPGRWVPLNGPDVALNGEVGHIVGVRWIEV